MQKIRHTAHTTMRKNMMAAAVGSLLSSFCKFAKKFIFSGATTASHILASAVTSKSRDGVQFIRTPLVDMPIPTCLGFPPHTAAALLPTWFIGALMGFVSMYMMREGGRSIAQASPQTFSAQGHECARFLPEQVPLASSCSRISSQHLSLASPSPLG